MKYLDVKGGGQKAMGGAPENKALGGAPENKGAAIDGADALKGVQFGSPSAKKKAEEAGLTAASFKRKRASSDKGFTVTDVERIAATADEG